MNLERLLLKLRWDPPQRPLYRLLDRLRKRHTNPRRRARWSNVRPTAPHELSVQPNLNAVQRIWPGAADREWIKNAAKRWPADHAEATRRATDAAAGRFDLLSSGITDVRDPTGHIRWHTDFKSGATWDHTRLHLDVPICLPDEGSDIKIPWELSRFQHVFAFIWTETANRYSDVFLEQWNDWLRANPLARGTNWACAMDVALRAISWTVALAAWGEQWDEPTRRRMWAALYDHGRFIRDNLEWITGPRTNHYFSDIVGLAVIGASLTPLPQARAWTDFAAAELRREILAQFATDGFNKECSTTYHRLMLELTTLGYQASRCAGADLGPKVRDRLIAAYRALQVLCDSQGHVPIVGDNDSGRVFPLAYRDDTYMTHLLPLGAAILDADELRGPASSPEVALLCGPAALDPTEHQSRDGKLTTTAGHALQSSGFFVLGNDADRVIVRCGPLSYRPTGSHRHLDQLTINVTVGGLPIIVDPGQFCYTPWPDWRHHFVADENHAGLTIDDQPQCRRFILAHGAFTIIPEDRPTCLSYDPGETNASFAGQHRGYERLTGGAPHRRELRYSTNPSTWTLTDRLPLRGPHRLRWNFCLHPQVTAQQISDEWHLCRGASTLVLGCHGPARRSSHLAESWYAPAYGTKLATHALIFELASNGPVTAEFIMTAHIQETSP